MICLYEMRFECKITDMYDYDAFGNKFHRGY